MIAISANPTGIKPKDFPPPVVTSRVEYWSLGGMAFTAVTVKGPGGGMSGGCGAIAWVPLLWSRARASGTISKATQVLIMPVMIRKTSQRKKNHYVAWTHRPSVKVVPHVFDKLEFGE
jgi:hypothetical protein